MTKSEFLTILDKELKGLSKGEKERAEVFFSEMIDDRVEDGMSEEDAVASAGTPEAAAAQVLAEAGEAKKAGKKFTVQCCPVTEKFNSLCVSDTFCDVRIVPSDDGKCTVEYPVHKKMLHTVGVHNGVLTVTGESESLIHFLFIKLNAVVTVKIPAGEYEKLSVSTKSGDITVEEGFTVGEIRIESKYGDTSLCANTGKADVSLVSGDVKLSGSAEELNVKTMNGDVAIIGEKAAETTVSAKNGDVKISDFDAQTLKIDCLNGDIRMTDFDAHAIEVITMNGDVHCRVRTPKKIDLKAKRGTMNPVFFDASEANGTCAISTENGDIRFEIGD